MKTKLVSAKLDRVSQPAAGDLRSGCRGEEATGQTGNQAVDGKWQRGQGDGERSKQRRIRCRELRHGPAARPRRAVKAERILLVGLGKLTTAEVRKAAGAAVRFAKPRKLRELSLAIPEGLDPAAATRALVEGAYIGDFDPDTYRSDRKDQSIEQLTIVAGSGAKEAAVEAGLREGVILGEAQNFTRSLVNEPGNVMTPTVLGQKAAEMCAQYGLSCEVYGADKLKELKMGAFWGVTKGSEEPPALIVMTYEPKGAPADAGAWPGG